MEYQECLSQLRNRVKKEILNGLEIHMKPIPETDQAGVPDPRVFKVVPATNSPIFGL